MTISLKVYEANNSTYVDTLTTAREIRWHDDLSGPGMLTFTFSAADESASNLVQTDRVVRVADDAGDLFSAVITRQAKRRVDDEPAEVAVECVGLRGLLDNSVVYPEGGVGDDVLQLRQTPRLFGWQSSNTLFDHSSWTAAASHGRQDSNPFATARPTGWPNSADAAEFIWSTHTAGTAAPGVVYFRKSFKTAVDQDVVFVASADDELTAYIDGQEIGTHGGVGRWNDYMSQSFRLPAGDHVLAIVGTNYERPTGDGTSVAWVLAALLVAEPDGDPAEQNETWEVDRGGATGGTFKLRFDDLDWTDPIAYNASASTVAARLEATADTLDVTVTGTGTSGDPWVIEASGDEQAGHAHSLAANDNALTGGSITIDNTQDGAYAPVIVKTDTTWRHLPYPVDTPGVTVGAVWDTLFDEAKARGELVGLSCAVTSTVNTAGEAWSDTVELAVPVGATLGQVAGMLEDAGVDIHVSPDGTVGLWEDKGDDVSGDVVFAYGTNLTSLQHDRDGHRFDRMLIQTQEGWAVKEAVSPSAIQPRSGYMSAGAFPSASAFDFWATKALAAADGQADVTTITTEDELLGTIPEVSTSYVGAAKTEHSAVQTGRTHNLPSGLQAGDLLVLWVLTRNAEILTGPSGWTQHWMTRHSISNPSGGHEEYGLWTKVSDGTETTVSHTTAAGVSDTSVIAHAVAFRNAVLVEARVVESSTAPTVEGYDRGMLACFFGSSFENTASFSGPPSGMTEIYRGTDAAGNKTRWMSAYEALTEDGQTGTRATTAAVDDYVHAVSVSIRPPQQRPDNAPYEAFAVGDRVSIDDWTGEAGTHLVLSIGGQVDDETGQVTWTVEAQSWS